jgi:uncharacterized protein (TIGR02231 family)
MTHKTDNKSSASESTITAVTVFLDRAIVTRTIARKIDKGEHLLTFDNLPDNVDQNSIQASGQGKAVLKDVKFKNVYYSIITDEEKRLLNEKAIVLNDSLIDANDIIANAIKEKEMTEDLMKKTMIRISSVPAGENVPSEADPEKGIKMITYYREKIDIISKEIRATERKIRSLNEELRSVQEKINELGGMEGKYKNIAEVLIDVQEESDVVIDLSYMVYGPCWYPVYDLRVYSETKKMNITYQAMIQQSTAEDWDNVKIKLSTARANISGQQPSLQPWYLNIYDPTVLRKSMHAASGAIAGKNEKARMTQMMNAMDVSEIKDEKYRGEEAAASIRVTEADVEKGATSTVFIVPGTNTIRSDNQQHKVTIMMNEYDAVFRYSTVPKLVPYAYLKARVKNTSEFPFLPGSTSVFLDNNFISTSQMDLVNPDQKFWTFLGVDDGMEVKYKVIKHNYRDEGFISRKNKYIYEYIIQITSNKKTEEEIVVWDQIPLSNNADIKVILLEPEIESKNNKIKISDYKFIEWFFKIKPKEKIKIPFSFCIEAPKDKSVSGL